MAKIVELGAPSPMKRPRAAVRHRKSKEDPEIFAIFVLKLKAFFHFLLWILCRKINNEHHNAEISDQDTSDDVVILPKKANKKMIFHPAASDSGNQSAANSDDLASNASSDGIASTDSLQQQNRILSTNQAQDDLIMNFRCLKRQNSSGNLATPVKSSSGLFHSSEAFSTPPRYPLRTSSSMSQISCVEASPAPTIKTVIDKSVSSGSQIPVTKSPLLNNPQNSTKTNRTLGDMEREMTEMQKTIVDLRLRLELYYEQSHGKFSSASDMEIRKMALALENENRSLKEKINQLESDLARALENYPQLVAELNAARSKLAYTQQQIATRPEVATAATSMIDDAYMAEINACQRCETLKFEKDELTTQFNSAKFELTRMMEEIREKEFEYQTKIVELGSETRRLTDDLKSETDRFEKARRDAEANEKAQNSQISTLQEQLKVLSQEIESQRQLRQNAMTEAQKRQQLASEKEIAITKDAEELRSQLAEKLEEISTLHRELLSREELLKTHKQTAQWEYDDLKRRFDELEFSKREEIIALEEKVRSLTVIKERDEVDLGLPRSSSSPVAKAEEVVLVETPSAAALLVDQSKDAMMSAMGSELAKFAKQLAVRDKAIIGLSKMLQRQNLQVAEEFKNLLGELITNNNNNNKDHSVLQDERVALTSSQTQCDEFELCEYFVKLLHVLQLSDDEDTLKRKISELESALKSGNFENDEDIVDDALSQIRRRIQVLEVANRFLNGEIALACSERDRILGENSDENGVAFSRNHQQQQQCASCDLTKEKYRRLKKDFRSVLKQQQRDGDLVAGSLHSICKKCELIDAEFRHAIEQKDQVIERLIADLASLAQGNKRNGNERDAGRKSACAQTEVAQSRSRSVALPSRSDTSSTAMRSPTQNTSDSNQDPTSILGDLQKYLPKLWKRVGKLRSLCSSLFTEQKIYEAIITARLQPPLMKDRYFSSSSGISTSDSDTAAVIGDLKTLRTLGCRLSTANNDASTLEENVRALEKRFIRRLATTSNGKYGPRQNHRRAESISPCRNCSCASKNSAAQPLAVSIVSRDNDQAKFEMSELFAEIQTLKEQLQRAIHTNSALKTKLEEQVSGQQSSSSTTHTTHHIISSSSEIVIPLPTSSTARPLQVVSNGVQTFMKHGTSDSSLDKNGLNSPPGCDTPPSVAEYNDNLCSSTKNCRQSPSKHNAKDQQTSTQDLNGLHERYPRVSTSPSDNKFSSPTAVNRSQSGTLSRTRLSGSTEAIDSQTHMGRRNVAERCSFSGNHRVRGVSCHASGRSPLQGEYNGRSSSQDARLFTSSSVIGGPATATLFAVGRLEEFEHLKREIEESFSILRTLENKVKARLNVLIHQQQQFSNSGASQSPAVAALAASESLHLKELQLSASELRVCLNQQKQLAQQFTVNQLPPVNARGKFVDVELLSENTQLIEQITTWKNKYEAAERLLRNMQEKLEQRNRAKEVVENAMCSRLEKHEEVLHQVRSNLQRNLAEITSAAMTSRPPRSSGGSRTPLPDKHNHIISSASSPTKR